MNNAFCTWTVCFEKLAFSKKRSELVAADYSVLSRNRTQSKDLLSYLLLTPGKFFEVCLFEVFLNSDNAPR